MYKTVRIPVWYPHTYKKDQNCSLIWWFLWKRRNTILHGGLYPYEKVIHEINNTINKFTISKFPFSQNLPRTWPAIVNVLENWEPRFRHKIVRWRRPPGGCYKCKFDGASKGNSGPSLAAFCVRNCFGDIVIVKGKRIPDSTSLVAEAVAIKEGIQFCIDRNLLPLIVETDSHTMVQVLEERWEVPWSVVMEVEAIKRMREGVPVHVKHPLREGNTLADLFANMTVNFVGTYMVEKFQGIPSIAK